MNILLYSIIIPLISGFLTLFIPKRIKLGKEIFSLIISGITFLLTITLFLNRPLSLSIANSLMLRMDNLSSFVVLFIGLFGFLIVLYSAGYMKGKENLSQYYGYLLMTIGASIGAVLANNLVLFLVFWGFLGLTLYLLVNLGGPGASAAAKKTLIIIGGSDALMILGIGIIWYLSKTLMMDKISISLNDGLAMLAFISLAIGAFAKGGVMPLHTWIPACAEVAPTPVMAFLPASLDKLLGIYFLARISLDLFILRPNSAMSILLLIVGAITIIAAVMMALIQHRFKSLLSYHAVSQVGYMVLGIGTANPVGIAGGLFHMLNNAIYKYCLFLAGGAVEKKTGTGDLEKLGGLSKAMPVTYVCALIAALAISGIPPFNGFVSKWMVYQGVIELGKLGGRAWPLWLIAAIFGSALTLASFMKLIHTTFLGQKSEEIKRVDVKEVGISMWIPMVVLAALCVIFGIFAYSIPLKNFINPSIGRIISYPGLWSPSLATALILVGIAVGFLIYFLGNVKIGRVDEPFVGGTTISDDMRLSGVEFYNTVKDIPVIGFLYKKAEKGFFDIYEHGKKIIFFFTRKLQYLHNGVLPTYLAWCLLGMAILFFILIR